jgi:hypothetical protein
MIAYHHPNSGPWTGHTPVTIDGVGFAPFDSDEFHEHGFENKLYIRYASIEAPHKPLVGD